MILYKFGELYLENEIELDDDVYMIEGSGKVQSLENLFKITLKYVKDLNGIESYDKPDYHFEFLIHSKSSCENLSKAIDTYLGRAKVKKLLGCDFKSLTVRNLVDSWSDRYHLNGDEVYIKSKPKMYEYIKEYIELGRVN